MAEIELQCTVLDCKAGHGGKKFKTPAMAPALAMQMLAMHLESVHQQGGGGRGAVAAAVKPEKLPRPNVKKGVGEDKFLIFKDLWSRYKRSTGLLDEAMIRDQLLACCSEDLYEDLHNLHGSALDSKTEDELIRELRKLAVVAQNNMVNVVRLRSIPQDRDEPVRSYLAKLKGAASVCKLTVKSTGVEDESVSYADQEILHCLVKGLVDDDIRSQVLGATEEMDLEATVKFIEVKEAGKKANSYLDNGGNEALVNRVTGYKRAQKDDLIIGLQAEGDGTTVQKCKFCGRKGHGYSPNMSLKREQCPAWDKSCNACGAKGHFSKTRACRKKATVDRLDVKLLKKPIESKMQALRVKAKTKEMSGVHSLSAQKPVPHMREIDGEMVIAMPEDHPKVRVEVQVDAKTYEDNDLEAVLQRRVSKWTHKKQEQPRIKMLADTGAQVDCVSRAKFRELGLGEDQLLEPAVTLGCANTTGAGVLGVFFGKVVARGYDKSVEARTMFYVLKRGGCLLSRSTCRILGIIEEDFPKVGKYGKNMAEVDSVQQTSPDPHAGGGGNKHAGSSSFLLSTNQVGEAYQPPGECDPDDDRPCQCPRRELVDPPESCPIAMTVEHQDEIEKWILEYFGSSAFNVCKRQMMPCTEGPPMKIHTDPEAVPVAIHKPCPVPMHWREQVRKDIEADVKRGVLEKVPPGIADTWCARMVITPKKDGRPRRTVDLSALTKVGVRETHHTRAPFRVVCTVPQNMLKTTLDCVDGYHGVPLAEEDKHKTTFLTEWGRFRYARAPQGYGSSNDGYTLRTDQVLSKVPEAPEHVDYEKIVDDVIVWSPDMKTAFVRVCNMLSHCNKAGMVFSPKKFQFAREEVEYAGFVVGKDSVRPTPQYIQNILDFPTPKNISDVRSWFGLVNQVAYCFSKGTTMAPFRELLKPSNKFVWTEGLQKAFEQSKEEIVRLVRDGVKMFDPGRVTCLSTDFSKQGIGWILQQKVCECRTISPLCCDDGWRLVLAGGRFTIPAESRYSPTEGEALAVVVGLESSKYYTLGCKRLVVATDHKPLVSILGDRAMDTIANPRLLRIKEKALPWVFDIIHVPGWRQAAADAISRKRSENGLSAGLHNITAMMVTGKCTKIEESLSEEAQTSLACIQVANVNAEVGLVTWGKLQEATRQDTVLAKVMEMVERGFPDSQHDMPAETRPFHQFRHRLMVLDRVLCYKTRVVVPVALRQRVLDMLHSAHQGISGMTNRAEQAVFWPGITEDISRMRATCRTCVRNAPSQPAGEPVAPPSPSYPFQMVVSDYCHLEGFNYLVMADRYSGWMSIYAMGKGECDTDKLISYLKSYFMSYGVAEEFSSDFGPQYKSTKFQKFLEQYGVHHRVSSAFFPHSNSRAELAIKSAKRLLRDNVGAEGDLTNDRFLRAVLQYRNTPHPDTRLSPAQVIYGRQIRDFFPVVNNKYEPKQEWGLIQEARELAMARRLDRDGARLAEHTKKQAVLPIGTQVAVQNQTGRFAKKWDKSGIVIDNKDYDKVLVRLDGSRRITTRNRQFVKKIISPVVREVPSLTTPENHGARARQELDVGGVEPTHHNIGVPGNHPEVVEVPQDLHPGEGVGGGPAGRDLLPGHAFPSEVGTAGDADCAVSVEVEQQVGEVNDRLRRERKPNTFYSANEYDLSYIFVTEKKGVVGRYVKLN